VGAEQLVYVEVRDDHAYFQQGLVVSDVIHEKSRASSDDVVAGENLELGLPRLRHFLHQEAEVVRSVSGRVHWENGDVSRLHLYRLFTNSTFDGKIKFFALFSVD